MVGFQDHVVRHIGPTSCRFSAACCQETEKDTDVEHTDMPVVMRVLQRHDDEQSTVPVGLVIEESLKHLRPLDRQLLLFAGGSNLPAVRWLLHLGASLDICDENGSTSLHAACRTGSTRVASELLKQQAHIEATDVAEWTPLHIAAHMGRPEVVQRLLKARANSHARNNFGHVPMQLCANAATLHVFTHGKVAVPAQLEEEAKADTLQDGMDQIEGEPEWWFINPRPAFTNTLNYAPAANKIAVQLFNVQPTYGLAFLVAVGVAENYTFALHMLLADPDLSRERVGSFLGEPLSMCNAIRFGVFDSTPFMSTGVVTALSAALNAFKLPTDLQKVHRLVQGVAVAWWRHHQLWKEAEKTGSARAPEPAAKQDEGDGELVGLQLLQYLASCAVLAQLMFSTILLHWFVHREGGGWKEHMSVEVWMKLNRGIENGGHDVPEHVQRRIYRAITEKFWPSLDLSPALAMSHREVVAAQGAAEEPNSHVGSSVLSPLSLVESNVHLLDDALSVLPNGTRVRQHNHGELSSAVFRGEQVTFAADALTVSSLWPGGRALATLCSVFLLFSSMPGSTKKKAGAPGGSKVPPQQGKPVVPSAVIDARRLRLESVDETEFITTFVANTKTPAGPFGLVSSPSPPGIPVLHLLADGRWQHLTLAKLRIKFANGEDMTWWQSALAKCANCPVAEVRAHLHC